MSMTAEPTEAEIEVGAGTGANDADGGGNGCGCGCFTIPLLVIALWALIFGVTIDGKHYGIAECSCSKGVEIDR